MRVAWKTDKGKKKSVNEDALLIDEETGLFLLADGMSGPRAGRVASRLAVRKAHAFLKERLPRTIGGEILTLLKESIVLAHEAVQEASARHRALRGMGTTLMVLCIRGETAHLSHVGDSRAYLLGKGMELITKDHTLECGLNQDAMLRELFFFYKARVLSQALGPSKALVCDGHSVALRPGNIILLCSDGLTDMLSDGAIEELIGCHREDLELTSDVLVEAANRMGGKDNISVIMVAV